VDYTITITITITSHHLSHILTVSSGRNDYMLRFGTGRKFRSKLLAST